MKEKFAAATAAIDAGDLPTAEMLLRQIVDAEPRAHAAWDALAIAALLSGEPEMALARAQRAVELDRRNPFYRNSLGVALGELGRFAEAEAALRQALKQKPVYPQALFNLSKVLVKTGRTGDSLRALERAYAMQPDFPSLRYQLAYLYRLHGRPADARRMLDEIPGGLDSQGIETYAMCELDLGGPPAAIAYLRARIEEHPADRNIRETLGKMLLSAGRWREGWQHFRAAREAQPQVLPSRLEGQRVLLLSDEGLGDILFFLRWMRELRARGAQVVMSCAPRLAAVLQGQDFAVTTDTNPEQPGFGFALRTGALPVALQTESTPGALPLRAEPAKLDEWRGRLAALGPPPYLGLTWRAGTDILRRQEFGLPNRLLSKEIPLTELGAAVRGWRGTLLSLQREPYAGETDAVAAAAGARVHDLATANADLRDALALMALLDEYVAVSNTNVHLRAGAGLTARVLVPRPPEWRWMADGVESPWFPGFPIYRQPVSRDWREPLAALRRDLGL